MNIQKLLKCKEKSRKTMRQKGDLVYFCSLCGKRYDPNVMNYLSQPHNCMLTHNICANCATWLPYVEKLPDNAEIINHTLYIVEGYFEVGEKLYLGNYEDKFAVARNSNVCKFNRFHIIGEIPEHFWAIMPDTMKFINKKTYKLLEEHPFYHCQNKGCWDRKNCYWYYKEDEAEGGSWNEIPDNHKEGAEECPIFIKVQELEEKG